MLPITVLATIEHDGDVRDVAVEHRITVATGDRLVLRIPRSIGATYDLEGLPTEAGARAVPEGIEVRWTLSDEDVGEHDVRVTIRDADESSAMVVRVQVEQVGRSLFAPGAISSIFVPNDFQNLGMFVGGGVEIVPVAFAQRGSPWLPSHGRIYLDFEGLGSTHANVDPLFIGTLGFDLTLEATPHRRYMIPFVGAQVGVAYQNQNGAFGFAMPLAGVYAWASRTLHVALESGYWLPTTSADNLRGFRFAASLDFSTW